MSTSSPTTRTSDPPLLAPTAPSQARKRPLRTYGRRFAHAREQEEAPPRSEGDRAKPPDSGCAESTSQLPVPSQHEGTVQPNHGSILAYFKPLPPSSDKAPSHDASSDLADPPAPRSSPLALSRLRKRRRLTTRPRLSELVQPPNDGSGYCAQDGDGVVDEASTSRLRGSASSAITVNVKTEPHGMLRPALGEVAASTVNQLTQTARPLADGRTGNKSRSAKRAARDMAQTTLSLSVHKPGFTICSVCDILYNPLNEKDRKEHSRRHAAYSRAKRKTV